MSSRTLRLIARSLLTYPLGSQTSSTSPLVLAKLVDRFGFATWYLTEFDPQTRIARAYVSGIGLQTWTMVSLDELLSVRAFGILKRVHLDRDFKPCYFRQLPAVNPVKPAPHRHR